MIGALLTVLSISRVFPTKVKPDLSTITDPFSGLSKSLDRDLIIKSLKELKLYKSYKKNARCTLY
jgi:transposase